MLDCADRLLLNWKRVHDGTLFRGEFNRFHLSAVQRQIEQLLWRGRHCAAEQTRHVCTELDRVYESLWSFAPPADVEPTNNAVEHALHAGVRWRKVS